jgi:hypothetical protein
MWHMRKYSSFHERIERPNQGKWFKVNDLNHSVTDTPANVVTLSFRFISAIENLNNNSGYYKKI